MQKRLQESIRVMELFEQRNKILNVIGKASTNETAEKTRDEVLEQCCKILIENNEFCLVWAGKRQDDEQEIMPIAAVNSVKLPERDCMDLIEQVVLEMHDSNPAARALTSGKPVVIQDIFQEKDMDVLQEAATRTGFTSCSCWPLLYKDQEYGVLCIHSEHANGFSEVEIDFLQNIIIDISL
ncbi:MAG: GAF domain-containing protein, partial [Deltaproteobacteria bacterium]|nr:GAF domain-containing protein [Deltaproteobacteria bacterium]